MTVHLFALVTSLLGPALAQAQVGPFQTTAAGHLGMPRVTNGSTVSADGRYVLFSAGGVVQLYERSTGLMTPVSVASDGTLADSTSEHGGMSPDARFIVFDSTADNLVPGDAGRSPEVYLRDMQSGLTEKVSVTNDGVEGDEASHAGSVSADGRYVLFISHATNIDPTDVNEHEDLFLRDRQAGTTRRLVIRPDGPPEMGVNAVIGDIFGRIALSEDGRYAAFTSWGLWKLIDDPQRMNQVFLLDVQSDTPLLVSRGADGGVGNWTSRFMDMAQGRWIVYATQATNIVPALNHHLWDIVLFDAGTGQSSRVDVAMDGGLPNGGPPALDNVIAISADGRYAAFVSNAQNLVPGDTNGQFDVFLRDLAAGTTVRLSVLPDGRQPAQNCRDVSISGDGSAVAFRCDDGLFVSDDVGGQLLIWDRNLAAQAAAAAVKAEPAEPAEEELPEGWAWCRSEDDPPFSMVCPAGWSEAKVQEAPALLPQLRWEWLRGVAFDGREAGIEASQAVYLYSINEPMPTARIRMAIGEAARKQGLQVGLTDWPAEGNHWVCEEVTTDGTTTWAAYVSRFPYVYVVRVTMPTETAEVSREGFEFILDHLRTGKP